MPHGAPGATIVMAKPIPRGKRVNFESWEGRDAWLEHHITRVDVASAPVLVEASAPMTLTHSMLECFESGRPFSFTRSQSLIDRVRMLRAWERLKRAPERCNWGI